MIRSFLAHFWKFDSLPWEAVQAFPASSLPSETLAPEGRPRGSLARWDKAVGVEKGFQGQMTSGPGRRGDAAQR